MILQGLVQYYETLAKRGEISKSGWNPSKVTYALNLNEEGELRSILSLKTEQQVGKKTDLLPRILSVPLPEKRASGILAQFLCDTNSYFLGIDSKGKPKRTQDCFLASKERHEEILAEVNCPAAQAILLFFQNWKPEEAENHPVLQEKWEEIKNETGNFIFFYNLRSVLEEESICKAWDLEYEKKSNTAEDSAIMTCLVTGKKSVIPHIHSAIKGVQGAQSSGAALISFNAPSFCSYEREQNFNAPVGQYAVFAYTTALNHLLAQREERFQIGDTTVVCWAETGEKAYQQVGMMGMGMKYLQANDVDIQNKLLRTLDNISKGTTSDWEGTVLSPDTKFYILGLAPNAARLSVRFFLKNNFSGFLANVQEHQKRLDISKSTTDHFEQIPLWHLLQETVNQKSTDKNPSPQMTGQVLKAILQNTPYPATFLTGVQSRIRAEHQISRGRAAIIKAYYLQNKHQQCPKEVLTVSLNKETNNIPYVLGRLFSVLEEVQELAATSKLNATIKDKYFNSASSTPSNIFPHLLNLAQKHLRKLKAGIKVNKEKQIQELLDKLGEEFPSQLTLPERGSFQLGYYQQTQDRYTKKEVSTTESMEE